MTVLGREYVWPDVVGTPTDPTEAYFVVGPVGQIGQETALNILVTVAGVACRAVQLIVEVMLDGANYIYFAERTMQCGAVGNLGCTFELPSNCQYRFTARRWGGTANTLVTAYASARHLPGFSNRDGEIAELAAHQPDGVLCWSDGAGAADALPLAFDAGPPAPADPHWIPTGLGDTMVIEALLSAGPTTNAQFQVSQSPDGGVTEYILPAVSLVTDGLVDQDVAIEQIAGANGRYRTRPIAVDPSSAVLVRARRVGAAADCIAWARFYRTRGV